VTTISDIIPIEILFMGIILISGLIIGILIERVIYPYLNKGAKTKRLTNLSIVLKSLQGETLIWTMVVSIYSLVFFIPNHLITDYIRSIINDILLVILVLSISWFMGNATIQFIEYYTRKGVLPKTSIFDNLLAALGVGGLAIALALQPTLANLFSGITILSARQISPGDYVSLAGGEEGYVNDVNWRNTTIRSLDNTMVIIPNSVLDSLIVTNYSLPITEMNLRIPVGVSYDSDLLKVEEVTIAVAKEVMQQIPGGVPNFEPFIRFTEFGDSSVNFMATLRIRSFADIRLVRHEFIKRLHTRFNRESIDIPFPIRTVYLKPDNSDKEIPVTAKDEYI